MKILKILYGSRKIGVSVSSYQNLIEKCRHKFSLPKSCELCLLYEDGTEIDEDFFPAVEDGDTLKLHQVNDTEKLINSALRSFETFIRQCISQEPNISNQLQEVITTGNVSDLHEFIASHPVIPGETKLSLRSEHPQWFEGVAGRQQRKENVLRGSAECRMRSYLQHVQKELHHLAESEEANEDDNSVRLLSRVQQVIAHFKLRLKEQKFNASYFDRSHPNACCRLCDTEGKFLCGGEYNNISCQAGHSINPYATRQNRIIFSTWNLDHMIEKSRRVIPALKKILLNQPVENINLDYFFDLLFTKYDPHFSAGKRQSSPESDQLDGMCKKVKLCGYLKNFNIPNENNTSCEVNSHFAIDTTFSQPHIISKNISFTSTPHKEIIGERGATNFNEVDGNKLFGSVAAYTAKLSCDNSPQHTSNSSKHTVSKTRKASPSKQPNQPPIAMQAQPSCSPVSQPASLRADRDFSLSNLSFKSLSSVAHEPKDHLRPWPGNLKLVHIACHVKQPHDMQCNSKFLYQNSK